MMIKQTLAMFVGSLVLIASSAAEDDVGLYGRLQVGAALVSDIDQSIGYGNVFFAVEVPSRQQLVAQTGYSLGAAVGFRYSSGFRTELEYRFSSTEVEERTLSGGSLFVTQSSDPEERIQAHFLMSNVYYDFKNSSPVTPYLGVGVGGARVSQGQLGGEDTAFAYQGRAGLNIDIGPKTTVGIDYAYARTGDLVFESETGFPSTAELTGASYVSSSVMATLTKNF